MKNLRYTLANEMFGNKQLLKAVAFAMFVRYRTGKSSVNNFSVNMIAKAVGVHALTVGKRMESLKEAGLVSVDGCCVTFRSLVSRHNDRNVRLTKIVYKSLKTVEKSLQAILVTVLQKRKDFAKRTIRTAHDGRTPKEVKAAMKTSRKYGWGEKFVERGISYAKLAKKIGVCVKTAVEIVKFAVKRGILKKERHFESFFMPGVNGREVEGFTFTTRNWGFKVSANTYAVAKVLA